MTTTKSKVKHRSAREALEAAVNTHMVRNATYRDNYHVHGPVMMALFPGGVELKSREDHKRFGVLTQCVAKLTRYAAQFENGGHADSAHDLIVYAAMLEELSL